jgi:hypothetical protein
MKRLNEYFNIFYKLLHEILYYNITRIYQASDSVLFNAEHTKKKYFLFPYLLRITETSFHDTHTWHTDYFLLMLGLVSLISHAIKIIYN